MGTLDTPYLAVLTTRDEVGAVDIGLDPLLQACLACVDQVVTFWRWAVVGKLLRDAISVTAEAFELLRIGIGLAFLCWTSHG